MGITIQTPDVNISGKDFTPIAEKNTILYGLGSIKGVGESAIPEIIANRPYMSVEDMITKIPKKAINKRVGLALISSGACKLFDDNRYALMNQFHTLRKDKVDLFDEEMYDEQICMELETTTLGAPITYKPWWSTVEENDAVQFVATVKKVFEKTDRNGNMMGFVTLEAQGCTIDAVVFARTYCNNVDKFEIYNDVFPKVLVKGKKDGKGKLIVSSVKSA